MCASKRMRWVAVTEGGKRILEFSVTLCTKITLTCTKSDSHFVTQFIFYTPFENCRERNEVE